MIKCFMDEALDQMKRNTKPFHSHKNNLKVPPSATSKGVSMYDIAKLSDEQLQILALYILPRPYPATDLFDDMCADLSIFKTKELRGTIGYLRGQFYNNIFKKSPYWLIIDKHFRRDGFCPICNKQKQLLIYGPSFDHLGVNHLHPEDYTLACGDCHHMLYILSKDTRLWRPLRVEQEMQVCIFIDKLKQISG